VLSRGEIEVAKKKTAMISNGASRTFVVGLKQLKNAVGKSVVQPVIRFVSEGTLVNFSAGHNDDASIELDCPLIFSRHVSVGAAEAPIEWESGVEAHVQIPEVETCQIHSKRNGPDQKRWTKLSEHSTRKSLGCWTSRPTCCL
jgi:hypothetical protein